MKHAPHTVLLILLAVALAACLSTPGPTATPGPPPAPAATATLRASATPKPSATPALPALAVPAEFMDTRTSALAQMQQAQPGVRLDRVADGATALARLASKQANWAISTGFQPSPAARLLCLTPYVAIAHFSSPLDELSADRLRAIFQGKDWTGPVFYSGDAALLRRIIGVESFGPQVTQLPTWKAVVERVAGDRTALAFAPWSEVDARVKTLAIEGRSIAVNGMRGYAIGDAWWLSTASTAKTSISDDIVARFSCPIKEPVTFLAGGDMLLGWFVNDIYVKTRGPEYLFQRIKDLTRSADIAFGNFENPMSSRGAMENKGLMFRASPDVVKGLVYAGIDVVNLANNHIGDYGPQAVLDTLDILRQNNVGYIGAGKNRAEARSPWITTTKGVKIAMLGYNEIEPGFFAATDARAGSAWIEPENVYAEIKKAKTQADFVIASFHWGVEYTAFPNARQQEIARRAAESGAGLIVGTHPHVVQGVGFIGSTFVDYSIGDFVYSQPTRPATGEAILLRAVIEGQTLKQVQMIPIYIDHAQPYVISPVEAKFMMARIFDATRTYKGLPPSTEQAAGAPAAAILAQSAPPAASLSFVALNGQRADIVASGSGATQTQLTTSGALNDAPAWSPSGRMIAYSSARDGSVDIFVAAADGSGAANLTRNAAWDDYPSWSPDGKMIAFSSNREGPFHIYIMNTDGSNVRRLTDGDDWDTTPAWSPDGKQIAFASDRVGTFQIYTIAVDGGNRKQLTNHPNFNAFPAWSPDGTRIVYQSYQDESFAQGDDSVQDRDYEIMVMPASGGAAKRITDNQAADIHPAWSPDGKRIAFASDRSGSYQIYTMNVDGSSVSVVSSGPGAYVAPAWLP